MSPSWFAKTPYCSVRDWTRFLRHRIKNIRIHPSTRYRIRCGYIFFPLWRAYLFFSGFAVEFAGYVWTVAVSGTKKLRIRKYPDTCRRGLRHLFILTGTFLLNGLPLLTLISWETWIEEKMTSKAHQFKECNACIRCRINMQHGSFGLSHFQTCALHIS